MKNRMVSISLAVTLILSVALIGCGGEQIPKYSLTISSTEGGSVTTPGEEAFTYDEGEVVNLAAEAEEGYRFVNWTGDVGTIDDVNAASTSVTVDDNYSVTANFELAPTDTSSTEAQQLTGYLEEISRGWDQPSVDAANAILSNESLGPEAWESFFAEYFSQHYFTDDLRNYLQYPVYWWFSDTVHANLQQGLYSALTDIIIEESNTYIENDRGSLTRYSSIVQSIMNSHRFLNDMIRLQAPGVEYTDDIFEFYGNLVEDMGIIYGNDLLDVDEYPFAGAFRAQAHMNLVNALDLADTVSNQIVEILELTGTKKDVFKDYGVLVIDNQGLDQTQLRVINSILELVPNEMCNLTNITVNDFLGNTGDASMWFLSKSGVNIFGIGVGAWQENGFPDDVSPLYSDVFALVTIHELNHIVNAYYIEANDLLKERQELLLEQAGADNLNYLRSMFADDFFQNAPQEFFASISNQYFASSEHTLSLGIERFNQGRPEPLNQFLFFADVYSRGGSSTLLYVLDTDGNLTRSEVPILRDDNGHIIDLQIGAEHYGFELDADGNVISVILPGN